MGGRGEPSDEALLKELETTKEILLTMYDWRHKILVRFFVAIGAIVVAANWLWASDLKHLTALAIAAGAAIATAAAFMDHSTADVLKKLYASGKGVESKMRLPDNVGAFRALAADRRSNSSVLRFIYIGTAVIFGLFAIATAIIDLRID